MIREPIPKSPGIYLLHIFVKNDLALQIGKLGERFFPRGEYLYIGSAQNGLKKRIERHLGKRRRLFWHIDYLLANESVEIKDIIWHKEAGKEEECKIASLLRSFGEAIVGFGSTDCKCESHLYLLKGDKIIEKFKKTSVSPLKHFL